MLTKETVERITGVLFLVIVPLIIVTAVSDSGVDTRVNEFRGSLDDVSDEETRGYIRAGRFARMQVAARPCPSPRSPTVHGAGAAAAHTALWAWVLATESPRLSQTLGQRVASGRDLRDG